LSVAFDLDSDSDFDFDFDSDFDFDFDSDFDFDFDSDFKSHKPCHSDRGRSGSDGEVEEPAVCFRTQVPQPQSAALLIFRKFLPIQLTAITGSITLQPYAPS
jgi:hypothetical protein